MPKKISEYERDIRNIRNRIPYLNVNQELRRKHTEISNVISRIEDMIENPSDEKIDKARCEKALEDARQLQATINKQIVAGEKVQAGVEKIALFEGEYIRAQTARATKGFYSEFHGDGKYSQASLDKAKDSLLEAQMVQAELGKQHTALDLIIKDINPKQKNAKKSEKEVLASKAGSIEDEMPIRDQMHQEAQRELSTLRSNQGYLVKILKSHLRQQDDLGLSKEERDTLELEALESEETLSAEQITHIFDAPNSKGEDKPVALEQISAILAAARKLSVHLSKKVSAIEGIDKYQDLDKALARKYPKKSLIDVRKELDDNFLQNLDKINEIISSRQYNSKRTSKKIKQQLDSQVDLLKKYNEILSADIDEINAYLEMRGFSTEQQILITNSNEVDNYLTEFEATIRDIPMYEEAVAAYDKAPTARQKVITNLEGQISGVEGEISSLNAEINASYQERLVLVEQMKVAQANIDQKLKPTVVEISGARELHVVELAAKEALVTANLDSIFGDGYGSETFFKWMSSDESPEKAMILDKIESYRRSDNFLKLIDKVEYLDEIPPFYGEQKQLVRDIFDNFLNHNIKKSIDDKTISTNAKKVISTVDVHIKESSNIPSTQRALLAKIVVHTVKLDKDPSPENLAAYKPLIQAVRPVEDLREVSNSMHTFGSWVADKLLSLSETFDHKGWIKWSSNVVRGAAYFLQRDGLFGGKHGNAEKTQEIKERLNDAKQMEDVVREAETRDTPKSTT